MTDEVAALVLRDNYFQTQALSIAGRVAPALLDAQHRFIQFLEKAGRLDRAIEFLPTDEEIAERRAKKLGLTAPERAVLLAYSKMWLSDEFVDSDLPEDAWIATALGRYFPQALREAYAGVMPRHPLRREIIATHVVNSMVNRVGSTFVHRLMETTGAHAPEIVRAYLLAARGLRLRAAVAVDRGARQQGARPDPVGDADRGRTAHGARDLVVPALAPARRADGADDRAVPARRGDAVRGARGACSTRRRARSSTSRRCAGRRPACRARSPRASPRSTRCSRRSTSSRWPMRRRGAVPTVAGVYFAALVEARHRLAARSHRPDPRRQPLAGAREELDARRPRGARAHARRQRARGGRRPTSPPRSSPSGSARIATRWTAPRASSASCARRPRRTWRCSRWVCGSSGTSREDGVGPRARGRRGGRAAQGVEAKRTPPELATLRAAGSRRTAGSCRSRGPSGAPQDQQRRSHAARRPIRVPPLIAAPMVTAVTPPGRPPR